MSSTSPTNLQFVMLSLILILTSKRGEPPRARSDKPNMNPFLLEDGGKVESARDIRRQRHGHPANRPREEAERARACAV